MKRGPILDTAKACIMRDRAETYGSAEIGFAAIAQVWTAMDLARGNRPFAACDVAVRMIAVKLVRASANPRHLDNWVDICGFSALGGEIATDSDPQESGAHHD